MKKFPIVFIGSLVTILIGIGEFAAPVQAQSDAITVNVPYRFTVGAQNISPGTYQFGLVLNQFLLAVIDVKTGHMKVFDVRPERERPVEQYGRLVFRNSAGDRVLNEIHFPGTNVFSQVIYLRQTARVRTKKPSTGNSMAVVRH